MQEQVGKARLEAFSDGVIAIIVTIMVLELKPPHGADAHALLAIWPTLAAYAVSFTFVAIYWINHRHLLGRARQIDNRVLWLNMGLLFWLSLVPFATAWLGEHVTEAFPVALYATLFLLCACSFLALAWAISIHHQDDEDQALDHAHALKNVVSLALYLGAIPLAYVNTWLSLSVVVFVGALYFVPETWLERRELGAGQKKEAAEAASVHREETPRKGNGVRDAEQD